MAAAGDRGSPGAQAIKVIETLGDQTMAGKEQSAAKRRIAQALTVKNRYGKTLTQDTGNPRKAKHKLRPKGNPLKGTYGFKYTVDF